MTASVRFGRTGLTVSPLCLGTSSWGLPRGTETIADRDNRIGGLADAFFAGTLGTTVIDTSNVYGDALSEGLIGAAIARAGGVASGLTVQTKLDRSLPGGDFSADRMWRSLEESLDRLGLDAVPVLYLHDPEAIGFDASMAEGGPVNALLEMKAQGITQSIGISGGPVDMLERFIETDLFDALVTHNRFTLVDRSADSLLKAATAHDVGVTNAAPYGAGVLTGDPRFAGSYGYRSIRPPLQAAIDSLATLCERYGIPMAAAALQFSLREQRVHSTIVGSSSLAQFERAVAGSSVAIPQDFWAEADALVPDGIALDD